MKIPYNCLIVADGLFPKSDAVLTCMREAAYSIACDGAVEKMAAAGFEPDLIVGDLDSLSEPFRIKYADRIRRIGNQENNDLTKAVMQAREAGFESVCIVGATGLREDHTLGNISLLADYAPHFREICMISDFGCFIAFERSCTLPCIAGQQISVFSLTPEMPVTVSGLRWPIQNRPLLSWWEGTLNEALTDHFMLEIPPGARLIVYLASPAV